MISLSYLLGVSICWVVFLALYHWILRKEKFLVFNRGYLMGAFLLGLLIPLLNWPLFSISKTESTALGQIVVELPTYSVWADGTSGVVASNAPLAIHPVVLIFLIGILVASIRLTYQLFRIQKLFAQSECLPKGGYFLVRSKLVASPFSFFNLLFWKADEELDSPEAKVMLSHERAHIRQGHSYDILFLEIIGLVFWWNPAWHFFGKYLREVHEYLADQEAIQYASPKKYGQLLIEQCLKGPQLPLAHGWNHSSLKNRIHMLVQKKSPDTNLWKYALSLPLILGLILACENIKDVEPADEMYQGDNYDEAVVIGFGNTTGDNANTFDSKAYQNSMDIKEQEVFKVVEEMPVFGDCSGITGEELKKCSDNAMLRHIYTNIKYPVEAREVKAEGTVVASMVVAKDGSVQGIEIMRPVHPALDAEVTRILKEMPNWSAGKQRGELVNVRIILPVKFRLE